MNNENSNRDAVECIYEANNSGIWLWLENGALKLKLPQDIDSSGIIAKIRTKKEAIIDVLTNNKICHSDYIEDNIYKLCLDESSLSFAQQRLWFIEQYEQGTNAYHIPAIWQLDSKTSLPALKYALQKIVSRHEVLRSTIRQSDNEQYGTQNVHYRELPIEEIILRETEDYDAHIRSEINQPFDLSAEYPIRVKFYFIVGISDSDQKKILMLINIHHIANDGWSTDIFQKELYAYYEAYIKQDLEFNLPEPEIQYKDFAFWQRTYLRGEILERQLNYWKDKLSGFQILNLPVDYPRPDKVDYKGAIEMFNLSAKVSRLLRELVQKYGVTMHSVMLSSINILLSKYSGQNDIVTGCPIANREHRQTQGIIGFFVNTQVNRVLLSPDQSYADLIKQVHNDQKQNQLYQDLPFEKLVEELGLERDISRNPIFQVSFVVQSFGNQEKAGEQQLNYLRPYQLPELYETTKFDLSFYVDDSREEMRVVINYATALFNKDTIIRLIHHYEHLLEGLALIPDVPYSQFALISRAEEQEILNWNNTRKQFPQQTLTEICMGGINRWADNIAVIDSVGEYTYKQLGIDSDTIAGNLHIKKLAVRNQLVAVLIEKGYQQVVATLGIMRSGAAYLPLHVEWPESRIDEVLIQGNVSCVVVSSNQYMSHIAGSSIASKYLWLVIEDVLKSEPDVLADPLPDAGPEDIAYVIFTSGSTGTPKGVTISHQGAVNTIHAINERFNVGNTDRVLALSELSFDLSVYDIFGLLAAGGCIVFPHQDRPVDPAYWFELAENNNVTIWNTVPQLMQLLADYIEISERTLPHLRVVLMSGDWIPLRLPAQVRQLSKDAIIMSLGGATEGSIWSVWYEINEVNPDWLSVPYGLAMPNQSMFVLDEQLHHCPPGLSGDIYIGGAGVALGYWQDEEKTAARFFEHKDLGRLYKTGDRGRWNRNGYMVFEGRTDDQVKIRGYRIELGEIEHALSLIKGVKQNCVLVRERKADTGIDKYLVGYYVQDSDWQPVNDDEILEVWEDLYNSEYEKVIGEEAIEADFTGWNSYITGEAFPNADMRLWRDEIVDNIKMLKPKHVLEIGVGTGLLMYPLLKDIQSYVGLDISQSVIRRHKERLRDKANKTSFYHLKADQIDELPDGELYDTVIVNSVCQYFPGIAYFEIMLEQALAKLSAGGAVFLGDIRNYEGHKELIRDRSVFRGESYSQKEIDQIALKENELLISPDYFRRLTRRNEKIEVTVLPRTGRYENELSKYRYDVLIRVLGEGKIINNRFVIDEVPGGDNKRKSGNDHNIPHLNQLSKEEIIRQLSELLPSYMVPATMIAIEAFPITGNGKLDRRALPDPDFGISGKEFSPPVTEIETTLCRIWQEVLALDRVGITDEFFRIGGNSISAIQVSHRMSKALGCEVKVSDVFKYKSISELLRNSLGQVQISIPKTEGTQAPLSFAQERLWFIEQFEGGTNVYHIPIMFELGADTDISGLEYALGMVVNRHEVLRSTIEQSDINDHGIQWVHEGELNIEKAGLSDQSAFENLIKADINRPFDLSSEYPVRVKFYFIKDPLNIHNKRTILLINIHHIAADGWSIDILQKELFVYYESYIYGNKEFSLPDLDIQYKDYAVWQRKYLIGEVLEKQLKYWREKLFGYHTLNLPVDFVRPKTFDYRGASEVFTLNYEVSQQLKALGQMYGITMHSVLLGSINILLGKYSGQEDIITGSPIANRQYRQTDGLIGFFVNTQVNRAKLDSTQSYVEHIKQVYLDQIKGQLHQDLPFEKLVEELGLERDVSRHPVFQVSFVVQSFGNQGRAGDRQKNYLKPIGLPELYETTKFDLSFFMDDSQDCIQLFINYATALFNRETILRLVHHYKNLLEGLVANPDKPYSKVNLAGTEEYNKIVYQWNSTDTEYPEEKTIHELFAAKAEILPGNIALVFEDRRLTYKELNERSNQLARHIRTRYEQRVKRSLAPDTLIGLYTDRSLEMVIGIFAILKAGGAYVPIDINYPQERVDFLLQDSGVTLILTQRHLISGNGVLLPIDKIICIDLSEELYIGAEFSNLPPISTSADLAYVIYTSGTTGKPKGVMAEHKGVINLACSGKNQFDVNPDSRLLQFASIVFDASVWEIFLATLSGATLFIAPAVVRQDAQLLYEFLTANKITTALLPPVILDLLPFVSDDLSTLLVGGDICSLLVMNKWSIGRRLINAYGPTEITVYATNNEFESGDLNNNIGTPVANMRTYVLDENCLPVPIGVTGELFIGGAGVARGYLNQPELTSHRFIPNQFATETDRVKGYTRLYKTGDLVRWLSTGELQFIGRNDGQVKIRGFRVELEEVEQAMSRIRGIKQNCVLVKERKTETGIEKYLVGYYVQDSDWQSTNDTEILEGWEDLYDSEYEKTIGDETVESDFSGWNSYITGEAIPIAEMQLWRNEIIDNIKMLRPVHVLEVGVGSGLLMYPLLNEVYNYVGLDLSQSVINRHKERLRDKDYKTKFYHLKADQIDELPDDEFYDTVIINSVCQYFPGIGYFEEMLAQALAKLSAGGSVFLGDIRNYSGHKELIRDRFAYRGESCSQREIEQIALKENELLISPDYFRRLMKRNEKIEVRVLPRTGSYENELSKYRYDVLIRVKGEGRIINNRFIIDQAPGSNSKWKTGNDYNIPYLNQLSKEEIIRQLSEMLPLYMVPATMVAMESLPATINGKLDRLALPDPEFEAYGEEYVAPVTETETILCRIWQEVLGLERVGITDEFFRIGGNSISAIQVSHRMSKALGYGISVADVFLYRSIEKLSSNIFCESLEYIEGIL